MAVENKRLVELTRKATTTTTTKKTGINHYFHVSSLKIA